MSMNVYIKGARDITVNKTGQQAIQYIHFDAWQTRTEETYRIVNSPDPIQAYREWVMEQIPDCDRQVPVYADDDFWCETITGYENSNSAQDHLAEFDQWLSSCEVDGYRVTIEVI